MPEDLEPGWYPRTDGTRRYWDGSNWLDIPEPAAPDSSRGTTPRRRLPRRVAALAALIFVLAVGGTVAALAVHRNDQRAERQEREAAQRADEEAAKRKAAAQARASAAAEDAERTRRATVVTEVEGSVKKMARSHADDGILDAAPLKGVEAACEPVDGSYDDLLAQTTTFKCFVPTKAASGGTYEGFNYHATVNWDSGEYTYGLGAP